MLTPSREYPNTETPPTRERELDTANVEVIGFADILPEERYRKGPLGEECDLELLEEGGGHPRKKSFQIHTRTFEPKPAKICKGDVFQPWGMQLVHLRVMGRKMEVTGNLECFQVRHE
jgi:hypothetical protein